MYSTPRIAEWTGGGSGDWGGGVVILIAFSQQQSISKNHFSKSKKEIRMRFSANHFLWMFCYHIKYFRSSSIIAKPHLCLILKVVSNENQGVLGRWQMIGTGLGLWWKMSFCLLNWPPSWINSISFSAHSSLLVKLKGALKGASERNFKIGKYLLLTE